MRRFITLLFLCCFTLAYYTSSAETKIEEGKATYYAKSCRSKTASGERMDPYKMTCAHKSHPFGTLLKVTNEKNGKSVVVKVNDRGPFGRGLIVDLSWGAAKEIDMLMDGVVKVKVEVLEDEPEDTPEGNTLLQSDSIESNDQIDNSDQDLEVLEELEEI